MFAGERDQPAVPGSQVYRTTAWQKISGQSRSPYNGVRQADLSGGGTLPLHARLQQRFL